ncbi:uncharacterized protein KIAA1958-like [Ambystoma mexicanum]|uniref:uncharacterized protein KIAA1958-like n=1 Tax=Ambystoma mexicanum TaxID=8296 RepID=UPI0037E8C252
MLNEMDSAINTTEVDLSNLMTWAHTHGTICSQIPTLENVQQARARHRDNTVLWICAGGHAYNWPCRGSVFGSLEEKEDKGERKKRRTSYDMWQGERSSLGKKCKIVSEKTQTMKSSRKSTASGKGPEDGMFYVMCNPLSLKDHLNAPPDRQKEWEIESGGSCPCSTPNLHCQDASCYRKTYVEDGEAESQEVKEEIIDESLFETDEEGQSSQAAGKTIGDSWSKDVYSEGEFQESEHRQGSPPTNTTPSSDVIHSESTSPLALLHKPNSHNGAKTDSSLPDPEGTSLSPATILNSDNHSDIISQNEIMEVAQASIAVGKSSITRSPKQFRSCSPRRLDQHIVEGESEAGLKGLEVACHVPCSDSSSDTMPELVALSPAETGILEVTELGTPDQSKLHPRNFSIVTNLCTSESNLGEKSMFQTSNKKIPKKADSKKGRTIADIRMFRDWLTLNYPEEHREVQAMPPQELDNYLTAFYTKVRKVNGMEFSANSFLFFQTSIDRYLRENRYEYNIARGAQFTTSQEALKHKYQNLLQKEKERDWTIVQKLSDKDVESLRKKGVLSRLHPEGLLNLLFINNVRGFGVRRQLQGTALAWGHITVKKAPDGSECLEWKGNQTIEADTKDSAPRIYSKPKDPENCPVLDYQEYARRRPMDMLFDAAPFYLSPKPLYCLWDQTWYCRKPLAKSKMSKIMKIIIHQVKQSDTKTK